jgi:DNA polymerase (family 10)
MTNKEIARAFTDLADIMELHGENTFRIRTYQNAYITLRKLDTPLSTMSRADMEAVKGVGKAIADKIEELLRTGEMQAYRQYTDKTPSGVVDMLRIKGFGPKKVEAVWKELGIETVGELLYACNENRLIELHGFGKKTQDEILKNADYYLKSRNKIHWAVADEMAMDVVKHLEANIKKTGTAPDFRIERVGALRRYLPVIERLEFLIAGVPNLSELLDKPSLLLIEQKADSYLAKTESGFPVFIYTCELQAFGSKFFKYASSPDFLKAFIKNTVERTPSGEGADFKNLADEKQVFEKAQIPYIAPELREDASILNKAEASNLPNLIHLGDIRGVIHSHSTWSDGLQSIEAMAAAAQELGYQYLGMTDHSKAAFYANGLKEDRLVAQWAEIDKLNQSLFNFKILKGIESDILSDGSLDYAEDILRGFDFVIASIHSNLKMTEEKATNRLIKAIENPYTTILGHPTGRLLLSRTAYPIDHKKIIEACAANGVAIELNANPYRLDLDWTWIPYARDCGVLISINPDAHSVAGIQDIRYGVLTARKGGLDAEGCLNARDVDGFLKFCKK